MFSLLEGHTSLMETFVTDITDRDICHIYTSLMETFVTYHYIT